MQQVTVQKSTQLIRKGVVTACVEDYDSDGRWLLRHHDKVVFTIVATPCLMLSA